ncbi:peptidoglycan DD-metalloendopeptidase family protein [Prolixibacteraceae bacterium Z1-6]|uniref:Peptidoglycan DD-metalloendopeptidase family protein n=1 Tax=Draconibacterium aestuarii TaxID=2998507 RepID=A0A9X3F8R9_9BACT|nr:peptidoglycan DD-metalloendopeptidase family protein [Prolixibacteraceae bacterium Z1-6]
MRSVFLSGLLLLVQSICFGQSIAELQEKKQQAAKEIEYTTRLLNDTQRSEKSSLGKLRLLNNKINQRNTVLSSISNEINIYEDFIADNILAIEMLHDDLKKLKHEYAEMVKMAYKNKGASDELLFLLSAESFNQAYRRWLYFKRYVSFRQNQAVIIATVEEVLNANIAKLEQQKQVKQQLIEATQKEKQALSKEQGQQNAELQQLKKKKRTLQQKLNEQRKIEQQLEREIERIIEEVTGAGGNAKSIEFALTPEQKLVGNNFEENKQRLPWPVERGVILEHFGIHQHPVLTNVQVQNNGINIATERGAKVRAVFNGEVSRVFGISGGNTAVIIRHGTYLSVYSNLREVVVKKGDKVSTKQNIGTVYTDEDQSNKSILKFQIWKETTKLNPELWIGR